MDKSNMILGIDIPDDEYEDLINSMGSNDDSLYYRLEVGLYHIPWISDKERDLILEHIPI